MPSGRSYWTGSRYLNFILARNTWRQPFLFANFAIDLDSTLSLWRAWIPLSPILTPDSEYLTFFPFHHSRCCWEADMPAFSRLSTFPIFSASLLLTFFLNVSSASSFFKVVFYILNQKYRLGITLSKHSFLLF